MNSRARRVIIRPSRGRTQEIVVHLPEATDKHVNRRTGVFDWNEESVRWSVESDLDEPDRVLATFESRLFPHGWVSRGVEAGATIYFEEDVLGWHRYGAL